MKNFKCMSKEQSDIESAAHRAKGHIVHVDRDINVVDWYDENGTPCSYWILSIWEDQNEFDNDGF